MVQIALLKFYRGDFPARVAYFASKLQPLQEHILWLGLTSALWLEVKKTCEECMEPKWSSALRASWRQNRKKPGVILLAGILLVPQTISYKTRWISLLNPLLWLVAVLSSPAFRVLTPYMHNGAWCYCWTLAYRVLLYRSLVTVFQVCSVSSQITAVYLGKVFFPPKVCQGFPFSIPGPASGIKNDSPDRQVKQNKEIKRSQNGQLSFSTDGGRQFLHGHSPRGSLALMRS